MEIKRYQDWLFEQKSMQEDCGCNSPLVEQDDKVQIGTERIKVGEKTTTSEKTFAIDNKTYPAVINLP